MSERDITLQPADERDEVARLEAQLQKAKFDANTKEAFGKFDVTTPNIGEDTYESYFAARPEEGTIRDGDAYRNSSDGTYVSAADYENNNGTTSRYDSEQYERSQQNEVAYEAMTLKALARQYGASEAADDKSSAVEILTILDAKMNQKSQDNGWSEATKDLHYATLMDIADKEMRGVNEQAQAVSAGDTVIPEESAKAPEAIADPSDAPETTLAATTDNEAIYEATATNGNEVIYEVTDGGAATTSPAESSEAEVALEVATEATSAEESAQTNEPGDAESIPAPEEATPTLAVEALDPQKQSIWERVKNRTSELFAKAGAITSTTLYVVGSSMPQPEKKLGETNEEFEKRAKRIGAVKLLGAVAIVTALSLLAKHGLEGLGDGLDSRDNSDLGNGDGGAGFEIGHADGGAGIDGYTPEKTTPITEIAFSPEASNAEQGEGWYQTFTEMGITDSTEQANILNKVGPDLQAGGWAYPMGNGSWGISRSGELPNDVLKLIKNSR